MVHDLLDPRLLAHRQGDVDGVQILAFGRLEEIIDAPEQRPGGARRLVARLLAVKAHHVHAHPGVGAEDVGHPTADLGDADEGDTPLVVSKGPEITQAQPQADAEAEHPRQGREVPHQQDQPLGWAEAPLAGQGGRRGGDGEGGAPEDRHLDQLAAEPHEPP